MGKVIVDLSMSLDGYIAGPNDGPGNPLGDGGDAPFFVLTHDPPDTDPGEGIQVSVVPVLLGGGVRLFDRQKTGPIALEQTRVVESDGVTHLRYRVVK
jgi:hypothetical protein